tara:strand:- start:140 stop:490 length:351 start_codon:yes stop_codon:yes gene_type:complete
MASHNKLGCLGENIAKDFLKQRGFIIIAMNWRHLHYEIDIIARHQNILVFVEVKTRSTFKYGFPDESIDHKKENRLREAAEIYIEHKDLHNEIRFDIVSIVKNNFEEKVYHITDAF